MWLAVRAVVNLSKLFSRTSLSFYGFVGLFIGMLSVQTSAGDVEFPIPSPAARISVTADEGSRSIQGSYTVYQLKGHCRIRQGSLEARAQEAVLWVEEAIANQQTYPTKRSSSWMAARALNGVLDSASKHDNGWGDCIAFFLSMLRPYVGARTLHRRELWNGYLKTTA